MLYYQLIVAKYVSPESIFYIVCFLKFHEKQKLIIFHSKVNLKKKRNRTKISFTDKPIMGMSIRGQHNKYFHKLYFLHPNKLSLTSRVQFSYALNKSRLMIFDYFEMSNLRKKEKKMHVI